MKIRTNYVSNSSSSSYIIAVGLIKKEFEEFIEKFVNESTYNWVFDLVDGDDEHVEAGAFNGDFVNMNIPKGRKALIIESCGDILTDAEGEIIGEPCLSDFPTEVQLIIEEHYPMFDELEYRMGSGYNG
jgi:hypothetical protein